MKFIIVHLLLLLLIIIYPGYCEGNSISFVTDPPVLDVYQANTWASAVKIDPASKTDIKDSTKIEYIKLHDYKIHSEAGNYGKTFIYLFNENGDSTRLKSGKTNKDFKNQKAEQKFYLTFYTNYLENDGKRLRINRPQISIGFND